MKSPPAEGKAQVSLFATGSEVPIAVEAHKLLAAKGVAARVVSVPCFELFFAAPDDYREAVIGTAPVRVGGRGRRAPGLGRHHRQRRPVCRHVRLRRQRAV